MCLEWFCGVFFVAGAQIRTTRCDLRRARGEKHARRCLKKFPACASWRGGMGGRVVCVWVCVLYHSWLLHAVTRGARGEKHARRSFGVFHVCGSWSGGYGRSFGVCVCVFRAPLGCIAHWRGKKVIGRGLRS